MKPRKILAIACLAGVISLGFAIKKAVRSKSYYTALLIVRSDPLWLLRRVQ